MKNKKNVSDNTHAAENLYGYGLQVRQMLYELLNCEKDCTVSVEKFDDVGVENDMTKKAIQTKSALSSRNPISNMSVDLWKTLYNWLNALIENELEMGSALFTLVINTNKRSEVTDLMINANDKSNADKSYNKIRNMFFDERGMYKKNNKTIEIYVRTFFNEKYKNYAIYIIEKFNLVVMDKSHTQKIYDDFCAKTYLPVEIQEFAFDKILGWIDRITSIQVEQGKVMQITKTEFNNKLIIFQKKINQDRYVSIIDKPTKEDILVESNKDKIYIKQLKIINLSEDDCLEAITDYLTACCNKSIMAKAGNINEEILDEYNNDLKDQWKIKKRKTELDHAEYEDVKKGQYLYWECQEYEITNSVVVMPRKVMSGCYHELSDQKIIGWHPEYLKILGEDDDK